MPDMNVLIRAVAAAEADLLVNGDGDGRWEALAQAEADLWWARVAERFGLPVGDPIEPIDLTAPAQTIVHMPEPPVPYDGLAHTLQMRQALAEQEPVRCMLHPAEWADAQGCPACCRIGLERVDRAEWTAQVGRRLASALHGIATGRVWSWETPNVYGVPGQPESLQIREML